MTFRASIHDPGSRVRRVPAWLGVGAALLLAGSGHSLAGERDTSLSCGDTRELVTLLVETTGQAIAGGGRSSQSGWRLQLYRGQRADVWTLIKVSADGGEACILDMGQGWATIIPPLAAR